MIDKAELERLAEDIETLHVGSDYAHGHRASIVRKVRALAAQPATVPEGMSLLVDALEGAMIESLHGEGFDLWAKNRGNLRNRLPESVGAIIVKMRTMLAAAPQPEAQEGADDYDERQKAARAELRRLGYPTINKPKPKPAEGRAMTSERSEIKNAAWDAYCKTPTARDCGRSKVDAAVDVALELARRLQPARVADAEARTDVVPGIMRCAKCEFQLQRVTLYMGNGAMGAGNSKTEPCPNGCGPLWPVTWEQHAKDGWETAERFFGELEAIRAAHPAPESREADHSPGAGNMVAEAGQRDKNAEALKRILAYADELDSRDARAKTAAWNREFDELIARRPTGQREGVEEIAEKLAEEISNAVMEDEQTEGCDISGGLFGPKFSSHPWLSNIP